MVATLSKTELGRPTNEPEPVIPDEAEMTDAVQAVFPVTIPPPLVSTLSVAEPSILAAPPSLATFEVRKKAPLTSTTAPLSANKNPPRVARFLLSIEEPRMLKVAEPEA